MTQAALPGLLARERALLLLEQTYGFWLAKAREIAMQVCREHGSVTSDDVLERLELPEGASHNVIGAIFANGAGGRFRASGYVPTRRPQGHGRRIVKWVRR